MVPIQLADIVARLDHISEVWRSDTSHEQRTDLADLDELLSRLDDTEPETAGDAERIDELRGPDRDPELAGSITEAAVAVWSTCLASVAALGLFACGAT